MLAATRRWLRRNRTYIAVGTAVVGGTYLVGQYVLGKLNEARERAQLDRIAKENIRRRFEQNQTDCSITVLALLPTLTDNLLHALPCEQVTHELQQKRAERLARASGDGHSEQSSQRDGDSASVASFPTGSYVYASQMMDGAPPKKSKAQLWNELKISAVTRSFTFIYSLSLLIMLTRIQLNLLGRLNYLQSVISLAQPPAPGRHNSISLEDHDDANAGLSFGHDFETNRKYLTYSWWIMHKGYAHILDKVRMAVEDVWGPVSPTEMLTADRLRGLVVEVRKRVEGATEHDRYAVKWLPYLLPPREEEEAMLVDSGFITPAPASPVHHQAQPPASGSHPGAGASASAVPSHPNTDSAPLRQLLDETADLIDSPSFTRVNTLVLNALFSQLIDQKVVQASYPQPNSQTPPASEAGGVPQPRLQEIESAVTVVPADPRVKLASILAILTRQAHVLGNGNAPNEYVSAVDAQVRELDSFAAVIYTNNLDQQTEPTEQARPKTAESGVKAAEAAPASRVSQAPADDETVEKDMESTWAKVTGSTGFSSR
ncbi:hypothetical protein DV737_g214, partial [Chaetothyriales sp. CBS 132003]